MNQQEKYGPVTNFFVFKWGNKYSAKYVNRLYNSICKFYKNMGLTSHAFQSFVTVESRDDDYTCY